MRKTNSASKFSLLLVLGILLNVAFSLKRGAYAVSETDSLQAQESISHNISLSSPDLSDIVTYDVRVASATDGRCEDTFSHPVGNVYFTYDNATGELRFSFQLSPSSRLLLGSTVRVAMVQAVVNYYLINPPYAPHIRTGNYDFHGRIYYYNRLGSSARFNIRRGDRLSFTWFVTGTNPRTIVTRRVDCNV